MPFPHLIETLAAECRTQRCAEVWRDVVEGRLSAREAAQAQVGLEPQARIDASAVLFAPVAEDVRDTLLDEVLAHASTGPAEADPAGVVPLRPAQSASRRRWILLGSAALAVAAALIVLVVGPGAPRDPDPIHDGIAQLDVAFELELSGGFASTRSVDASGGPLRLQPGSSFELVVRPQRDLGEGPAPGLAVFATREGEERVLSLTPERAPSGTMIVRGRVDELLRLPAGTWTLVVVVGPQAHLPSTAAAVEDGPAHWQTFRRRVEVVAE
ncbi:MAG: hypothetical protein AAF721_20895 [Myxococcota bacterium]